MNYDEMPTRKKEASDGEKARRCWCSGRCVFHYDENQWYRVECEHCGSIMGFRAPSHDFAIKMWNDSPSPTGNDATTKRNYEYRKKFQRDNDIRIVRNFLNHMTNAYRKRMVNWAVVQDILMEGTSTAGSTSCIAKCREIGIDPWGYTLEQVKEAGDGHNQDT